MTTDVNEFIGDLDGGILEEKLSKILSAVAGAVIDTNKTGRVTLQLDITKIGESFQVAVKHKLSFSRPTLHGKQSEEEVKATPMHVGTGGKMSLFPENQGQMFSKTGDPV